MNFNRNNPQYQEDLNYIISSIDAEPLREKSILVTGATGLIGTLIIDSLFALNTKGFDIRIYALGRSKERASDRLGLYYNDSRFFFLEQDIQHPLPVELNVDYIIHGASNAHPMAYSQDPIGTIMTNIKGIENVLNKALMCKAGVLFMSTVEIYGNARGEEIFTENYTGNLNLSNARSCYPESKRLCEAMCQSYIAQRNSNIKIVRLSRVFGPTMTEADSKASAQFLKKAKAGENIVLKSDGMQFFSYTYAADAVAAILYVLVKGEIGVPYNVSAEGCNVHLRDFAEICAKVAGRKVIYRQPIEIESNGFSKATNAILDNKLLQALGWKPHYDMIDAVERTINILQS